MFVFFKDLAGKLAGGIVWHLITRKFDGMSKNFGPNSIRCFSHRRRRGRLGRLCSRRSSRALTLGRGLISLHQKRNGSADSAGRPVAVRSVRIVPGSSRSAALTTASAERESHGGETRGEQCQ